MPTAQDVVAQLRRDIRTLEQRLFTHPYIAAVEGGRPSRVDLRVFAGQQHRIIESDLRSLALMLHRFAGTRSGEFFAAGLQTETAARERLRAFARAVGAETPEAVAAVEPLAGAQAYTHFVAWLALYGSDAEFAAAFLVNLPAWGKNCGRLARALRARYGLSDEEVAFFDLFAGEAPEFEEAALQVIQGGLDRAVAPTAVREAAKLLQSYELMYWDALQGALPADAKPGVD